jgi:hypothetical protein
LRVITYQNVNSGLLWFCDDDDDGNLFPNYYPRNGGEKTYPKEKSGS